MAPWIIALIDVGVVILIFVIILVCSIKIVSRTDKVIVERLGAYYKTWDTGIHMLIPFFDRIQQTVSMKEQVHGFDPQPVITKDNVTMHVETVCALSLKK